MSPAKRGRPRLANPATARRPKTITIAASALAWYEAEAERRREASGAPMSAGRIMTEVLEQHARAATGAAR